MTGTNIKAITTHSDLKAKEQENRCKQSKRKQNRWQQATPTNIQELILSSWFRHASDFHNESTFAHTEGDAYFTTKLQNYTAVERDEVKLVCELSKAVADVKWFKDGKEITPSKNIAIVTDGKKRVLMVRKAEKANIGEYTCDCGSDKTTAKLNIEGKPRICPSSRALCCFSKFSEHVQFLAVGKNPCKYNQSDLWPDKHTSRNQSVW